MSVGEFFAAVWQSTLPILAVLTGMLIVLAFIAAVVFALYCVALAVVLVLDRLGVIRL